MIGLEMWIAVMFFATWLPAHWKRRIVGAGLVADITVHAVLQTMFGGDAGGRVGMLFAGILINMTMHAYRRAYGWERFTSRGWIRYAGHLT